MRTALKPLSRYIATPEVSKHRFFVWLATQILPDKRLIVLASDDDTIFGILHSRIHEIWSLQLGATLEDRPCYRPTTCFETFPFPEGLTPKVPAGNYADNPHALAIASAARRLVELRDNWLNPPGAPVSELKKRTLTNLYNARPAWLSNAHRDLDEAVSAAYGWDADFSDDEVLSRLLKLNRERAKAS